MLTRAPQLLLTLFALQQHTTVDRLRQLTGVDVSMQYTNKSGPEPLDRDRLYLALTRPPMFFGVTDTYFVICMVVEVCIFVGVGGGQGMLYALAAAPALYVFGYLMCLRDPRIFTIWQVRLKEFSKAARQKSRWGGNSFDPR